MIQLTLVKPKFAVLVIHLAVCFVCSSSLLGQQVRFDHFDTRKGLSQNNINSLIVDSTGYIWIGTMEGVTRFDGNKFNSYRSFPSQSNSLKGNIINKLSACPNGNIWIQIRNRGINLYDVSSEKFHSFPDSCFFPSLINNLTSMVSPTDSCLWFTDESGLYCYETKRNKTRQISSPFPGGKISDAHDQNLIYWGNGGLSQISQKPPYQQQVLSSKPVKVISNVFNDSLCLFYSDAIHFINLKNKTIQNLEPTKELEQILKRNVIRSIAGYTNEIWIGINNGLVLINYEDQQIRDVSLFSYTPYDNYAFHGKDANNLVFDKLGNLWIGTSKYGINLYSRQKNLFEHHLISVLSKADQEIDPVRAICKTADQNIWVGFDRLGLVKINPDNTQKLYSNIHLPENKTRPLTSIRSLYVDSKKNLWLGTSSGLCLYNQKNDRIESVKLKYAWEWPSSVCYFMEELDPGQLTVTSPLGIGIIDLETGNLERVNMPQSHPSSSIRSLVKDGQSNYWFISDDLGLVKLTPKQELKYFTHETHQLTDNKLYSLVLLGDTLWIGSNNGLMAFDIRQEKLLASFFETDGLSNNLVYSIIHDGNYLWMSTNRGISRLDLRDNTIESFLPDDLFMDDAFYKDEDGEIYFGGYDGFISFEPSNIRDQENIPTAHITDLFINNQRVNIGQTINKQVILPQSIQMLDTIQMSYSTNSFSLAFDAFPFNYPDSPNFRYRLLGLSPNWILASKNENRAVFSNLEPGNYEFEVEVSNKAHHWSNPTRLTIVIVPPFHKTAWFRSLLATLAIIVILTIFKLRIYTIQKWNNQLERRIKEQTHSLEQQKNKIIAQKEQVVELSNRLHEADQAKLMFYTNVSHEFRTPLTIIIGYIEALKNQGVNRSVLKNMKRSSDRLLRLVNQFIDLQKYDQGELKLEITNFDIVLFIQEITDSFLELAARKNIQLHFNPGPQKLFVWLDRDKTDKIIYNLLSNAIKYTPEGGTIIVGIETHEKNFSINVTDTGCGISEEELPKIFKRFYRSDKVSATTDGHGMGLALVKALVDVQQGTITCNSRESGGTVFRLTFNLGNSQFDRAFITDTKPVKPAMDIAPPKAQTVNHSGPLFGYEILVVEDNPELLDYLTSLLSDQFRIETATNGKQALLKIEKNKPDLIITDLMMPVMDGISLIKELKRNPQTMLIPVVVLSAKTDEASKIESYQSNIDDFIEKPFNPNTLVTRIKNILQKRIDLQNNVNLVSSAPKKGSPPDEKNLYEKTLLLLEQNYSNPEFNADQLSDLVGMSRVTFYRKMKKIHGEGPGEIIRKYRLNKALILLQEGNKTVAEISSEVGFLSLSHFRKSFKAEHGVSPSKFR